MTSPNPDGIDATPHAPTRRVSVALANDYELVVEGLRAMLQPYLDRVHVADTSTAGVPAEVDRQVDVLLFDTYGRSDLGLGELTELVKDPNVANVAIYTWEWRPEVVQRALRTNVRGWLPKSIAAGELVDSLERIANGERVIRPHRGRHHGDSRWPGRDDGLTPRESEVYALLVSGMRNKEIGEALFLSPETVKFHVSRIYRKLRVTSRGQAIAQGMAAGAVSGSRSRPPSPADRS